MALATVVRYVTIAFLWSMNEKQRSRGNNAVVNGRRGSGNSNICLAQEKIVKSKIQCYENMASIGEEAVMRITFSYMTGITV